MTAAEQAEIVNGLLDPAVAARVHRILAAATDADGVPPLSEQARLAVDQDCVHVLSEHGYANVVVAPSGKSAAIEAVVDPSARRSGEGAALVRTALTAAAAYPEVQLWAHGDLPGAVALADRLSLARTRELLQLRLRLRGHVLPELAERADVRVRTYRGPADDAEILRVNNAAFDWHPEQGGWSQSQIAERTGADWFDPAGVFLAFDAAVPDRLLGFHWTKVHPVDDSGVRLGEVYIVGVDPAAQGRGLGSLLTLAGLHYLAQRGMDEIELYVEGDNAAALATYAGLGFTRYAVDVAYSGKTDDR